MGVVWGFKNSFINKRTINKVGLRVCVMLRTPNNSKTTRERAERRWGNIPGYGELGGEDHTLQSFGASTRTSEL